MVVRLKGAEAVLTMKAWSKDGELLDVDTFSYILKP
jgi:hypothetical protein